MGKAVRLDRLQLRSIIAEEVRLLGEANDDRIDPNSKLGVTNALAEFVGEALIRHLEEDVEVVANNAFEMAVGTLGDEVPVPARFEDIEGYSEKIADKLLKSPELREVVERIAASVLRNLMEEATP